MKVERMGRLGWWLQFKMPQKRTFFNSCNSVIGFGLAGIYRSLLAVGFGLLNLIEWLNPK
jgi:hypothetical protein